MNETDIPINVILLPNCELEQEQESLIDAYVDIIKSCRKKDELRSAIKMIVDECEELFLKKALIRHIQAYSELIGDKTNR